jgi:hypothetical protein
VLWSSDNLDLNLEDTDDAAYIENLVIDQIQASNVRELKIPQVHVDIRILRLLDIGTQGHLQLETF